MLFIFETFSANVEYAFVRILFFLQNYVMTIEKVFNVVHDSDNLKKRTGNKKNNN